MKVEGGSDEDREEGEGSEKRVSEDPRVGSIERERDRDRDRDGGDDGSLWLARATGR